MSSKGRKIIFIKDWGSYLSVKNGMFVCKVKKEVKWTISPVEVEAIVFLVNSLVSTEAIKLAQEYGVTIFFFNGNKPISLLLNAKYSGSMRIWLHQMRAYKKRDLEFAKEFAKGKLNNQLAHLRYYYKKYDIKDLLQYMGKIEGALNDVKLSKTVDEVRHYEAEGARNYWKGVVMLVPKELEFKKREKRGA
ncbi:MAG: CRISPR-associated endonuclease Cas1, partial [Sulfolobus sp.]|nr:CRISPR-associated endonuclease Cas1 [Sulfolobus sp.]